MNYTSRWRQRSEWVWCKTQQAYTALFEDPNGCVAQYTDQTCGSEQRAIAKEVPPYPVSDEEIVAAVRRLEAEGNHVMVEVETEIDHYQTTYTDVSNYETVSTPISTLLAKAAKELG